MLNETGNEVKYVIKVNGAIVSIEFPSRTLAEAAISNLPVEQQSLAEIAPVSGGNEILLG